jgi:peptidoglycan LD-endopeptidase CwlK
MGVLRMTFCLSKRSLSNLEGVHPDLVEVVKLAGELCSDEDLDFVITDGHRTTAEQVEFVKTGKSKTMASRHLNGFAIDYVGLVNGRATYDLEIMSRIAELFKAAAAELKVPIEWGGDWVSFKDTPHIQLAKRYYPDATTQEA